MNKLKKVRRKRTFRSRVTDDTIPCLFCCLVLSVTLVLSAHYVGQYSFYLYLSESEPRGASGRHFVLLVKRETYVELTLKMKVAELGNASFSSTEYY